MSTTEARNYLAELVDRAASGHERVLMGSHGRPRAALISAGDLELLEALEDARDVANYDRAREADTGERVPLQDLLAEGETDPSLHDRPLGQDPAG